MTALMIQCKSFGPDTANGMEDAINKWLKLEYLKYGISPENFDVIDVQYAIHPDGYHYALILYKSNIKD